MNSRKGFTFNPLSVSYFFKESVEIVLYVFTLAKKELFIHRLKYFAASTGKRFN